MKKTVFIFHGSYGSPNGNWFGWLKNELENEKIEVCIPKFPTPKNQSLENWMEVFSKYKDMVSENSVFIGHSLGVAFLLALLEKHKIDSAFLVSGFIGNLENEIFDSVNKTFTQRKFDWEKIRKNCKKFYIIHSDNDPYVPLKKAQEIAKYLGLKVIIIKGAGHFNSEAGYNKFELLLEKIKEAMDES
ncbi:MAG: alpha/beta hydrolase [Candidatus Micrarchaeia archaeon]